MCQVMQNGIVLAFTQGYQIGNTLVRYREQFLGDVIQLSPIAFLSPMTGCLRQVFGIILTLVIVIIEKILAVEFHKCQ